MQVHDELVFEVEAGAVDDLRHGLSVDVRCRGAGRAAFGRGGLRRTDEAHELGQRFSL